ncbi:TIM-barrel domain-containing protein [Caloramator sp. Dgby_cultured_2]|uniref:TIM-barrel domain-containing protein n=1 Tax=Caloramator sp. Dgby_cultured_2 TaxID=3029174 RepID=UPI00237DE7CC|nr:TIM-barrel domain-containing protein [Caloramator sp. Dgby_cultured_2]WDU83100.1 glycoside hydrolase family 31 protein [Caloramator sp. Dgby_cultured_2]
MVFENTKEAFNSGIIGYWNDEADEVNNTQFLNMQRALYEGQRDYTNKRVWSLNRNFFLGSQRYSYGIWSGDIDASSYTMAAQRERLLSSVNIGAVKWGMDTGGFRGSLQRRHI